MPRQMRLVAEHRLLRHPMPGDAARVEHVPHHALHVAGSHQSEEVDPGQRLLQEAVQDHHLREVHQHGGERASCGKRCQHRIGARELGRPVGVGTADHVGIEDRGTQAGAQALEMVEAEPVVTEPALQHAGELAMRIVAGSAEQLGLAVVEADDRGRTSPRDVLEQQHFQLLHAHPPADGRKHALVHPAPGCDRRAHLPAAATYPVTRAARREFVPPADLVRRIRPCASPRSARRGRPRRVRRSIPRGRSGRAAARPRARPGRSLAQRCAPPSESRP